MGKRKFIGILTAFLMVGAFYVFQASADAVDEYDQKCAGCHGENGLGAVYIDGSDCSLETIDDIVECYPLISAHNSVDACDDTCILDTNTYIFDELLLQIGENHYTEMCAQCHGDDGTGSSAIDGSDCDLNSLQAIVNCYPGISAHSAISSCDDTCVWHTNRYIFVELLGNADTEPADDTDDDSNHWVITREIEVENDVWLHCFIGASLR